MTGKNPSQSPFTKGGFLTLRVSKRGASPSFLIIPLP
jgi:hypothetical protein